MISELPIQPKPTDCIARAAELASEQLYSLGTHCDRIFVVLMLIEWISAIVVTAWLSPFTWNGPVSSVHQHLILAIFLGGLLTSLPIYLVWRFQGSAATRHAIAVAQMLWVALLIHLTGGRIETHFLIFGSLAYLAWYRDWRVLLTATIVTAADHALRGAFFPRSIYGAPTASFWRTLEHAGWVAVEDIFLLVAMRRSIKEMRQNSQMRAQLESNYARVDAEVRRQTTDLTFAKARAEAALQETQALRHTLDEHAIVSVTDQKGKITNINDAFCKISGYSREELIGHDHRLINSGTHPKEFWSRMWRTLVAGNSWHGEVCNRSKEGLLYWVDTMVAPFRDDDGHITKYVSIRTDITARKQAERRIYESEAFLYRVGQVAGVGGWQVNLSSRIVCWTAQTCKIHDTPSGYQPTLDEAIAFYAPEARATITKAVEDAINKGTAWDLELPVITAQGRRIQVRAVGEVELENGKPARLVGAIQDITHRKAMEEELRSAAQKDKLTGLSNRALLLERVKNSIDRHKLSPDYKYAVLFLDFDRFKMVNDSLGHDVGDQLLVEIARRLTTVTRTLTSVSYDANGSTASRLGGDEFVVLVDNLCAIDQAVTVAERLMHELSEPYNLGGHQIVSTASIGIVTSAYGHDRAEDVLRDADTAMYRAKSEGKDRFAIFDESMHSAALQRLQMESDLRKAIDHSEMFLMYQPIISLSTHEIEGFEALIRWRRSDQTVSPADFIPVAEDSGLIISIGRWAIEEAIRQLSLWQIDRPKLSMAINLSRKQLGDRDLLSYIQSALLKHAVPASSIKLEITESMVMQNGEAVLQIMNAFRALGVKISMDDFGTGHSSLACLHQFPFDVLKIDRSFMINLSAQRHTAAVIHAVLQLAHNLGMEVVAEGLETPDQVAFLQATDCDYGQGYLFAKPLSPADAVIMLGRKTLAPNLLQGLTAA